MIPDNLVERIESLRSRIQTYSPALRENETRTRMALIDPLLYALGWNISDPGMVMPEHRMSGGWADYALLGFDGHPIATVEAKKLGESLASHRMQMLNYANASGIEYAALTDGNHWELYSVFEKGQLEERRILDVSIVNTPAHEGALKLLLLWRPNLASSQPVYANVPIFGQIGRATSPQVEVKGETSLTRRSAPGWAALSEYSPPSGAPCPPAIRFWDGTERALVHWNEVLTSVVGKLYAEGRLTVHDLPIQWSSRTYSVHIEPVHPTGKPFANPKSVDGTPLFVNVNLNALQVRQNTQRLLERCGRNPSEVYLQVDL